VVPQGIGSGCHEKGGFGAGVRGGGVGGGGGVGLVGVGSGWRGGSYSKSPEKPVRLTVKQSVQVITIIPYDTHIQ